MVVAVILVFAVIALMALGLAIWYRSARRRTLSRRADLYQVHRSRWERSGDMDELNAMLDNMKEKD